MIDIKAQRCFRTEKAAPAGKTNRARRYRVPLAVGAALCLVGCAPQRVVLNGLRGAEYHDPIWRIADLDVLPAKCALLDDDGSVIVDFGPCRTSNWSVPPGDYELVVRVPCQPEGHQQVQIEGGRLPKEVRATVPLPPKKRSHLSPKAELRRFPEAIKDSVVVPVHFPPNSVVNLVRRWPDNDLNCRLGVVDVVDDGGLELPDDDGRPRYFLTMLDYLSEKPYPGPSAAEYVADQKAGRANHERAAQAEREQEKAERARKLDAIGEQEVTTGRCTTERYNALQKWLARHEPVVPDNPVGGRPQFSVVDHDIIVAGPTGTTVDLSPHSGGKLHVVAAGYLPQKLRVKDSKGYEITVQSPYERWLTPRELHLDSRALRAKPGDKLDVRVEGKGCVLVMLYREY